jgi:hypothetical protein
MHQKVGVKSFAAVLMAGSSSKAFGKGISTLGENTIAKEEEEDKVVQCFHLDSFV